MYKDIADFLAVPSEWIESWASMPVKGKATNPLMIPELVVYFFESLPIEQFNQSLKLNRLWYTECKCELEKRLQAYNKEKYWKTVADLNEARNDLNAWKRERNPTIGEEINSPLYKKYSGLLEKKYLIFTEWVAVGRALLRCGFIETYSVKYHEIIEDIQLLSYGLDPDEIPSHGSCDILEYWGDEDPDA
jgi:hypothetical protein